MATIKHKRTDTPSKVPLPADLADGELGINTADGRVYIRKADNSVVAVGIQSKSDLGLGNVSNTSDADKPISTATAEALAQKVGTNSPTFSGTPKAPTATAGTNSEQIATTAFVKAALDDAVGTIDGGTF